MSSSLLAESLPSKDGFRHEAFFYAGDHQFLEGTTAFIGEAVVARELILVVVSARKIDLLRDRLAADASCVRFADMDEIGTNPARIIPAWSEFVDEHGGRPLRGIGEPIWAERSSAELVECQRHESLLNVAFAGSAGFALMCPYDSAALGPDVVDEARRSHPFLRQDGAPSLSAQYVGIDVLARPFDAPLPPPPDSALDLVFQAGSLGGLRALVRREAMHAGLGDTRANDAVTAVNEVASNSLRHAGGWGVLRVWVAADAMICEVADDGHIDDPLVGRTLPKTGAQDGRGLWIANHLCELVQVRSTPTGTTVRMHFRPRRPV